MLVLTYQDFRKNMDDSTKKVYNVLIGVLAAIVAGIVIFVSYELVCHSQKNRIIQLPAEESSIEKRAYQSPSEKLEKNVKIKVEQEWKRVQEQAWNARQAHLKSMQDKERNRENGRPKS